MRFPLHDCAGRITPQRHMTETTMNDIVGRLTPGRHVVSLQGEGEPTMHPRFWDWEGRLRKSVGVPYTTIIGGRIDAERANRFPPKLGISLDAVDEFEVNRIGRPKLDPVHR